MASKPTIAKGVALRRRLIVAGGSTCLAILLASQTGCYRRVVKASGPTSSNYDIYQPNLSDQDANESIWKDDTKTVKKKK